MREDQIHTRKQLYLRHCTVGRCQRSLVARGSIPLTATLLTQALTPAQLPGLEVGAEGGVVDELEGDEVGG